MNTNRILCPIDFTRSCRAANYYGCMFAEAMHANLIYLHVDSETRLQRDRENRLDEVFAKLNVTISPFIRSVRHQYEVRKGKPGREIIKVANELDVDLIVMATKGKTNPATLLYGSVCAHVMRHANSPVMVVKPDFTMKWMISDEERDAIDAGWDR